MRSWTGSDPLSTRFVLASVVSVLSRGVLVTVGVATLLTPPDVGACQPPSCLLAGVAGWAYFWAVICVEVGTVVIAIAGVVILRRLVLAGWGPAASRVGTPRSARAKL
jgi:hypothetical protein